MIPISRCLTMTALIAASTHTACSGAAFDPSSKYITVFVSQDGVVEVNGEEASLSQLEAALQTAAGAGALVLFAREPTERNRGSHAMIVLQMIRDRKLQIRTCSKRDFSDAIGPDGKLRPR